MVQNYLFISFGPTEARCAALLRRPDLDHFRCHHIFLPMNHEPCVIREYASGGHGAADEPLAAHTVMVKVDCYSWDKAGFSLDVRRA